MKPTVRERHHRMEAKAARRRRRKGRPGRSIVQAQHSAAAAVVVDDFQRRVRHGVHVPPQSTGSRTEGDKRRWRTRLRDVFRRGQR